MPMGTLVRIRNPVIIRNLRFFSMSTFSWLTRACAPQTAQCAASLLVVMSPTYTLYMQTSIRFGKKREKLSELRGLGVSMAKEKVVLDSAGMKDLLNDPGVRAELTRRIAPVLAAAQSGAPVVSGDYKASIYVKQATTDRAVVRVVADVSYAMSVEANSGNLARALDSAGGA